MPLSRNGRAEHTTREWPASKFDAVIEDEETSLLLIGGRSGVGKSRTGEEIHHLLYEQEIQHAYIEGDNLDMAYPSPWREGHELAEKNLNAMWSNYWALGYRRLIYTNTAAVVASDALAGAIDGPVALTGVLLQANDETTRARLSGREIGSALDLHIERSRAASRRLDEQHRHGFTGCRQMASRFGRSRFGSLISPDGLDTQSTGSARVAQEDDLGTRAP